MRTGSESGDHKVRNKQSYITWKSERDVIGEDVETENGEVASGGVCPQQLRRYSPNFPLSPPLFIPLSAPFPTIFPTPPLPLVLPSPPLHSPPAAKRAPWNQLGRGSMGAL